MANSKEQLIEMQIQKWEAQKRAAAQEMQQPLPPRRRRRKRVAVLRARHDGHLEFHDWVAIAIVALGSLNHFAGKAHGVSPVTMLAGQNADTFVSALTALSVLYLAGMMAVFRKRSITIDEEMREVE